MRKKIFSIVLFGAMIVNFTACEVGLSENEKEILKQEIIDKIKEEQESDTKEDSDYSNDNRYAIHNGHEYVDLGLSVMWATCNVGAKNPEDYGDYFSWGEINPKDYYYWNTYEWCCYESGEDYVFFTKYYSECEAKKWYKGKVDNKNILEALDDAAYISWRGIWRMPTINEYQELMDSCTWEWLSQNKINGYKIKSKKNGNSIFLPASGCIWKAEYNDLSYCGYYWSSSLSSTDPDNACYLFFLENLDIINFHHRYIGQTIRPVFELSWK